MIKKYAYYIITFFVCINIGMCFLSDKNKLNNRKIQKIVVASQLQTDDLTEKLETLNQLSIIQYMAEGGTVNNIVLFGLDGDSVRLYEKLRTTPKLMYYFSANGCPGCFEPVLFRLDSLGKKIGYENRKSDGYFRDMEKKSKTVINE